MNYFRRLLQLSMALCVALQLAACSNTVQWDEEVKLNDGRVIVVTQKRRCEGGDYTAKTNASCIARESWMTIKLPEFSHKEIVWHESLKPMVVNVHQSRLYVVGRAPTTLEFRAYGASNPPYFGFVWSDGKWKRIPFIEIPEALYDGNMLIESIPKNTTGFLSLERKGSEAENGDPRYPLPLRRVDPNHTSSAY
ncbi:hypothetical protein [Polaromonas sp. LjRoot131]|uniref:hypothetical protein n=1 Tax=Polaromonas sp. LjRoot131 TaxID=3342262 RepID=UPI003ED109F0